MQSEPAIGVLITYHNEKELLAECLDSVFSQTVIPDEVMVYDDSSDFPAAGYVPAGYKVKLIRGERNMGPAYGRNLLFKESSSDYIHFHDADDIFLPLWCENVKTVIKETGADIILAEVSSFAEGRLLDRSIINLKKIAEGEDPVRFAINGSILTSSSILRRSVVEKIGGYRESHILPQSEDYDFHIRAVATGASHAEILNPLIRKRIRKESHSSRNEIEVWSSGVASISLLGKELPERYNQDLSEAAARMGSALYGLNAYADADRAYNLALSLGTPRYLTRKATFRFLARLFGPQRAERIKDACRRLSRRCNQ